MDKHFEAIIEDIGEDLDREGLVKTPARAAEAMRFLTRGYQEDLDRIVNNAIFESESDEMIVVRSIEFYSLCEHHMLPFFGECHVAYIPDRHIIGLSKIPRIVDVFARRLQLQERLTTQIAEAVRDATKARGVGVIMEGRHMCMMMRGVEKQNSAMKTSCMLGNFRSRPATRHEFLTLALK